jgi:coenzyme F420-reducing hydrogenase alpha subunit
MEKSSLSLLTRVEGEGRANIVVGDGKIKRIEVHIFEAPRFIEFGLKGRKPIEAPEITSRICGICSVSYQMASAKAFEYGMGIEVPYEEEEMRKAIFINEHIKSNVLHVLYLQLPDLLNASSSLEVFNKNPEIYKMATDLFMWSRKFMKVLGGRFHNIVNIRVGGVYSMPEKKEVEALSSQSERAITYARKLSEFVLDNQDKFPSYEQKIKPLVLCDAIEYPFISRNICSDEMRFEISKFEEEVIPEQVPYSNSLRYRLRSGENYVVGPISRFNTSFYNLRGEVRRMLKSYGYMPPLKNMSYSIVARIAELYEFILRITDFIDNYRYVQVNEKSFEIKEGTYYGAVEAPRGILYHRYTVNKRGLIEDANIIPPTSQNLISMEAFSMYHLEKIGLINKAEQLEKAHQEVQKIIRLFDPCISCSVH